MAAAVTIADGEMVERLRQAVKDCADRGLHQASKWYVRFIF